MKFAGSSRSPCFSLPSGIWSPEAKKLAGPTSRAEFINFTDLRISNRWNNPKFSPGRCDKSTPLMESTSAIGVRSFGDVTTFGHSFHRGGGRWEKAKLATSASSDDPGSENDNIKRTWDRTVIQSWKTRCRERGGGNMDAIIMRSQDLRGEQNLGM
jgi:hypothetical protein